MSHFSQISERGPADHRRLDTGKRAFARWTRTLALIALGVGSSAINTLSQAQTQAATNDGWSALRDGAIVLFRHANAPGGGDPPGFRLGDCSTQRNLDDTGRSQARRIGEAFRARGIRVGAVLSSQWCRTRDTATLAFGAAVQEDTRFNSFFQTPEQSDPQSAAARRVLTQWQGPGVLIVSTHQVNITALTGIVPASGEGVVLRAQGGELQVLGRVRP